MENIACRDVIGKWSYNLEVEVRLDIVLLFITLFELYLLSSSKNIAHDDWEYKINYLCHRLLSLLAHFKLFTM